MHIKSAAVQYTDPKTNITKVYCGYDHNTVYDDVAFSQNLYLRCMPYCCYEGFMTSEDNFASRSRALEIAKDAISLKIYIRILKIVFYILICLRRIIRNAHN